MLNDGVRPDGHQVCILSLYYLVKAETYHCIFGTWSYYEFSECTFSPIPREKPKRMENFSKERLDILLDVLLIYWARGSSIIAPEQSLLALKGSCDRRLVKRLKAVIKLHEQSY